MLKFGKGNAKLIGASASAFGLNPKKGQKIPIYTFSLPAGFTCPGAKECKSKARIDKSGNRFIADGPDTIFRCFAASQEVLFTNTYLARRHNLSELRGAKTTKKMAGLISDSLPKNVQVVRIHVSGDFFSQVYFDAWISVATDNPGVIFYAYTKSIPYAIKRAGQIPSNFRLTASIGGRYDSLVASSGLRTATVVYSKAQASGLGLPIDKDDSHAIGTGGNFALLLHGVQPKGSEASRALTRLKKIGLGSYSKGKKNA